MKSQTSLAGGPVGVLGGMGPLASAEFLRTIYERCAGRPEQRAPAVFLYSDPSFPDRTEAFLRGSEELVLRPLERALEALRGVGATRFILCCMTVHHVLPRLPEELRARVVPLTEAFFDAVEAEEGEHLLLCSSGSRTLRLLEDHPRWGSVRARIVLPDPGDQRRIHEEILYRVKTGADFEAASRLLDRLLTRYGVSSYAAGCSEVHVIAKHYRPVGSGPAPRCVDPFRRLAEAVAAGRLEGSLRTFPGPGTALPATAGALS